MRSSAVEKHRIFFKQATILGLLLSSFCVAQDVHAGAMKQLADANNAVYRDIKALGPKRRPEEIAAIQNKHYGPAFDALYKEHAQKRNDWKAAAKRIFASTKEAYLALLGPSQPGKKTGAPGGTPTPAPAPAGRNNVDNTTGEQGGVDGAKSVSFGGKRKEAAPKVNADGIILEK